MVPTPPYSQAGTNPLPPTTTDLKHTVLLGLIDTAGQAAVRQRIVDDVLVGLGAWLLV